MDLIISATQTQITHSINSKKVDVGELVPLKDQPKDSRYKLKLGIAALIGMCFFELAYNTYTFTTNAMKLGRLCSVLGRRYVIRRIKHIFLPFRK